MKILGTTERRTCEIAVEELNLPCTVDDFYKKFKQSCLDNLGNANLFKGRRILKFQKLIAYLKNYSGAERIIRHLHDKEVPFCLATSSSKESVEVKTRNYPELFKLFHHKVCGSTDPDVKEGKPAPDIFLVACSRFPDDVKPAECLVFEDAPNGVRAARSAGMQVVMVPDSNATDEMKKNATLVLKSLMHFRPEEFGLPKFTDDREE